MAYEVKQGNIFGRLGTGFGKGLAEQLPKEIERHRLSEGLKGLEQEGGNLTPFQQYARLAAIPGITPQMIQSGSELLKQQGIRSSLSRNAERNRRDQTPYESKLQEIQGAQFGGDRFNRPSAQGHPVIKDNLPSDYKSAEEQATAQPGVVQSNPLEKRFEHRGPWNPQEKMDNMARIGEDNPNMSLQEIKALSDDEEARDLAQPVAERQKRQDRLAIQDLADKEFDTQLETFLQKEGKDVYGDVTGEMKINLKKAMYNDLATNPKLTEKTAAEKWARKGLNLAKEKGIVNEIANRDIFDKLNPGKKEKTIKQLQSAQNIFKETGNNEEFYNILRSENDPANKQTGFGLSPGYASLIAYPRSERVKEVIKNTKTIPLGSLDKMEAKYRKLADDIANVISPNDSILAIARELKDKDRYFNERAFFDQIRDNEESYGLNSRLKRELTTGESDLFPNWGDIALFPSFGKSVAHD